MMIMNPDFTKKVQVFLMPGDRLFVFVPTMLACGEGDLHRGK